MKITFEILRPGARIPEAATEGAAGYDLYACPEGPSAWDNVRIMDPGSPPACPEEDGFLLTPGARVLMPTGIASEFPVGYHVEIRPRSGLATRGITVVNAPGTIDADYRGEWKVILQNIGSEPVLIRSGDRIAQAVFIRHERPEIRTGRVGDSERGAGGFGSTGA